MNAIKVYWRDLKQGDLLPVRLNNNMRALGNEPECYDLPDGEPCNTIAAITRGSRNRMILEMSNEDVIIGDEDCLAVVVQTPKFVDRSHYPGLCLECGNPAYVSTQFVDCSNKVCRHYTNR